MANYTLIVPSYNGGDYLKQCVQSILAQTHGDFELAVLDDASTDGSLDWLSGLGDARVRIYPAPQRLGIVDNWRRSLAIPKNEFMAIIGQDDLLDAHYLQVMTELIRREPQAGLYHAHFRYMDESGVAQPCRPLPSRETAAEYIAALFSGVRDTWGSGYMFRSADYEKVGGVPPFPGLLFADDALWIALMRRSFKAAAPEECFACRKHQSSAGHLANWRTWLGGLQCYVPFLQEVAESDVQFARALADYGPNYFFGFCRQLYAVALVEATKRNQRLKPEVREAIAAPLVRLSPGLAAQINRSRGVRAREWINRYAPLRWLYIAYILVRYGRGELPLSTNEP